MRRVVKQSGFSLLEMVVVVATILILAGALLGVGKYIKIRAEIDLTKSELEVLVTALQQYYTDWEAFPFVTDIDDDGDSFTDENSNGIFDDADTPDYDETVLEDPVAGLNGTVAPGDAIDNLDIAAASSAAMFYFLDKNPNSRKIAEALSDSLISNKDASGTAIEFTFATGETIGLPRFVDVWGNSLRYEYLPDTAFPILTSAGPDMKFGTPDDLISQ